MKLLKGPPEHLVKVLTLDLPEMPVICGWIFLPNDLKVLVAMISAHVRMTDRGLGNGFTVT